MVRTKSHKDVVALNAALVWAAGLVIYVKVLIKLYVQSIKEILGKNFYS